MAQNPPRLPDAATLALVGAGLALEIWCAARLLGSGAHAGINHAWIAAHALASMLVAFGTWRALAPVCRAELRDALGLLFALSFFMPVAGALGGAALGVAVRYAGSREKEEAFWELTPPVELPFAPPQNRSPERVDGRGFIEQIRFEGESQRLFNRIVATRHMRDSQAAPILRSALHHRSEKIRLLAYSMLDKKIERINRRIARLEALAEAGNGEVRANTHLQLASNYWELLSLEDAEATMRNQLLEKVRWHAAKATAIDPGNVNGHFTLGLVELRLRRPEQAERSLRLAMHLGMPNEKVLPYLAEVAFQQRRFASVRDHLRALPSAFRTYPPVAQLAEYWL